MNERDLSFWIDTYQTLAFWMVDFLKEMPKMFERRMFY